MSPSRLPPRAPGLPFIGSALNIAAAGSAPKFHLYVHENHRRLGPIYWDNLGVGYSGVFIADPVAARKVFLVEGSRPRHVVPQPWVLYNKRYNCKRGLFFMDGDEWLKHRQMLNPIFFKKNLTSTLEEVYDAVTDTLIHKCRKYEGKEIPNLEQLLYKHSISFTIGNLIGSTYVKQTNLFEEDIERLSYVTNSIFSSTAKLMNLPVKLAAALDLPAWKNFVEAVELSLDASRKLTKKIMQLELTEGTLKEIIKEDIDINVLQSLILDLMLAAGDTTAFTTQWALYLLSKNPAVVNKLREDNSIVRGILRETLRLYPAAIFLSRYIEEDLHVLNFVIPKGTLVMISLYTIGRLESVFPEAESFKPERWLRDVNGHLLGVREPMAYFPFALGARSCIGRKLAEAQICQTITKLFGNYDLQLLEDVSMELQMVPVPTKPIRLLVREKNQ